MPTRSGHPRHLTRTEYPAANEGPGRVPGACPEAVAGVLLTSLADKRQRRPVRGMRQDFGRHGPQVASCPHARPAGEVLDLSERKRPLKSDGGGAAEVVRLKLVNVRGQRDHADSLLHRIQPPGGIFSDGGPPPDRTNPGRTRLKGFFIQPETGSS